MLQNSAAFMMMGGVHSKTRRFVRTFSGRRRYNVLGAINFVTRKVHTITNATYITATEICQMLKTAAAEYPGKKIHIVLDNARYQKCELVTSLAKELAIDLIYINLAIHFVNEYNNKKKGSHI